MPLLLPSGFLAVILYLLLQAEPPAVDPGHDLAGVTDEKLFTQIGELSDIFTEGAIWPGYPYQRYRQYLVYTDETGPVRAFLVNPIVPPEAAIQLSPQESKGLRIYRYDDHMEAAYASLNGPRGNGIFDFPYDINGIEYYLQSYSDDLSMASGDSTQTVSFSTHELFHRYQEKWTPVPGHLQDFDNFPVTRDLLELQILCQEIMKDLPLLPRNGRQLAEVLAQYVAIRTEEMKLDTSTRKLIRYHGLAQEQMEGSARYVEVMANLRLLSTPTPYATFGYSLFEFEVESLSDARALVGQSVYYGTGAGAIYMLHRMGVDVVAGLEAGKTPYDLARAYLRLSGKEVETALQAAKAHPRWPAIQAMAEQWFFLD